MESWLNFEKLFILILKVFFKIDLLIKVSKIFESFLHIQNSWGGVIWHLCCKFLKIYPENTILNILS